MNLTLCECNSLRPGDLLVVDLRSQPALVRGGVAQATVWMDPDCLSGDVAGQISHNETFTVIGCHHNYVHGVSERGIVGYVYYEYLKRV